MEPTGQTTVNAAAAAELRAIVARRNSSRATLAAALGVSTMWVSRRLSGQTPLTLDDVARICSALDVPLSDVLNVAAT